MGKGLKAGKKKRPRLGKVTWDDLNAVQAEVDEKYDNLRLNATLDASKTVQNMFYYSLIKLGYGLSGVKAVENEMHNICMDIQSGELTFKQLYADLEYNGIEVSK